VIIKHDAQPGIQNHEEEIGKIYMLYILRHLFTDPGVKSLKT
jgi:hypothetical protein